MSPLRDSSETFTMRVGRAYRHALEDKLLVARLVVIDPIPLSAIISDPNAAAAEASRLSLLMQLEAFHDTPNVSTGIGLYASIANIASAVELHNAILARRIRAYQQLSYSFLLAQEGNVEQASSITDMAAMAFAKLSPHYQAVAQLMGATWRFKHGAPHHVARATASIAIATLDDNSAPFPLEATADIALMGHLFIAGLCKEEGDAAESNTHLARATAIAAHFELRRALIRQFSKQTSMRSSTQIASESIWCPQLI